MRFEGTVTINAARTFVWDRLMLPAVFEKIAPGVTNVRTLVEHERYLVDVNVPFGHNDIPTTLQAEIIWDNVIEAEQLDWSTCMPILQERIMSRGTMRFSGDAQCQIDFASDLTGVPTALPPALVHKLTSSGIRKFFTGLKNETEEAFASVEAG